MSEDTAYAGEPRRLSWLAVIGFILGLAGVLLLLAAVFGYRWGWWEFRFSFRPLLQYAGYAGLAAAILSLVALGRTWPGGVRRGLTLAVAGLVLGAASFYFPAINWWNVRTLPFIHDITTDTENPPEFVAVVETRERVGANPHVYAGEELAVLQRAGYPDIGPLTVAAPPERAFDAALAAASEMGWEIVASDPEAGRIEATDTTRWFRFKDDVVIRITATEDGGSRIDMRSLSRVGRSDVGANARRIRAYFEALGPRLS